MAVRIAVPITASIGDTVRMQYAVTSVGGTEPDTYSKLWTLGAAVSTDFLPATVYTPSLVTPSRVWIRLSGWENGRRITNYTTAESFDLGAQPSISSVVLTVDDGGWIVTWTATDDTEEVRIRWAVESDPNASPSWGSTVDVPARPGAFADPELPAMGERVWVELTPMLDSGGTLGTVLAKSDVRPVDYGTATCPVGWIFTTNGHPVRDGNLCVLTVAGVNVPGDWILTTGGVAVRANNLDILRRYT